MPRIPIPNDIQVKVEIMSKRRCALCYGWENDLNFKLGQIAHLDGNNSNNDFDNLCYLCLDHHNLLDARFRQTKSINPNEVKYFRNDLYLINQGKKQPQIVQRKEVENFLEMVNPFIIYLCNSGLDLGYQIHISFLVELESFLNNWEGYSMTIQTRQLINLAKELITYLKNIFYVFDNNYVSNDYVLTFKWTGESEHDYDLFATKKELLNDSIQGVFDIFRQIQQLIS